MSAKNESKQGGATGWRAYRRELTFLLLFLVLLGGSFTFVSLNWVNDHWIEPFTGLVATTSGKILDVIGQGVTMQGTVIKNETFQVNIRNGCNGVETMLIFASALLAFPAAWKPKAWGLVAGLVAIQAINLVRVVALFLTGVYFPKFFDTSHTVVWQTVVILFGLLLFIFWADRFAAPKNEAAS
ncbi:MAG: exosortase H [Acidobacteria bacterium]|nr:exosortase H [Acidobacteriota bacterium]